jgi:NAD(P)-dependent dehydrogenase (short-subunit alcohol dehydrogenase family)
LHTGSILITGCSSGIGYDAAHTLHRLGWQVFATCRSEADCERLRGEGLISMRLDYTDEDSIKAALAAVLVQSGGTLDVLFNNGAYAIPGAIEDVPRDAMRAIFEANVFGWQDLTNQVIPVMRAQGQGRIVNCSSVLGLIAMKWRGAYVATKFATEGLTDTLRMELKDSGIDVVLIEPGPIKTAFRANARAAFERWIDWENSQLVDLYKTRLLKRLYAAGETKDAFELPPSAVTKKLIHAISARRPRPRYFVTTPTYIANLIRRVLPTRLSDMILSWD